MTTQDYRLARRMRHQVEPVHAVACHAPECSLGRPLPDTRRRSGGPGYFAWLGAVSIRIPSSRRRAGEHRQRPAGRCLPLPPGGTRRA